jgi:hypothetical protein
MVVGSVARDRRVRAVVECWGLTREFSTFRCWELRRLSIVPQKEPLLSQGRQLSGRWRAAGNWIHTADNSNIPKPHSIGHLCDAVMNDRVRYPSSSLLLGMLSMQLSCIMSFTNPKWLPQHGRMKFNTRLVQCTIKLTYLRINCTAEPKSAPAYPEQPRT